MEPDKDRSQCSEGKIEVDEQHILAIGECWGTPPVRGKRVFVVSCFTGIGGALVALRFHGYHVVHVAYSEKDASCLRILRKHFPRATELGPCENVQTTRWFQDWAKEFDLVLFDS